MTQKYVAPKGVARTPIKNAPWGAFFIGLCVQAQLVRLQFWCVVNQPGRRSNQRRFVIHNQAN